MNNTRLTTFINYLFIFLVINYRIIVRFIIHFDSAGYGLIVLSILVFIINIRDFGLLQLKKPIVFWLLWCIYAVFNYIIHPHSNVSLSVVGLYRKIFIPLIALTVVAKEFKNNANGVLWICFFTHVVFMLAGNYFDTGLIEHDEDNDNYLGNAYANISAFTIFYLALLNKTKKIYMPVFLILVIVVIFVLAMTGTRKAFGAGIIMLAFWLFSQLKLQKIRTWFLVVALIMVGIQGYRYLMENTFIGARMEFLEQQQEQVALPTGAPDFLHVFGDRAPMYYYGWLSFISHPLFGVGTNQANVGGTYIHSEYMAQLADNGLVGFSLFIALYFWVTKKLLKRQNKNKQINRCMLGGLFGLLFIYLTAWAWEFPQYFICLGVLVGYCHYGYETPQVESDENN